jgi:hypothetical protein
MLVKFGVSTFFTEVASRDVNIADGGEVFLIDIVPSFSTVSLFDRTLEGKG